MEMKICPSVLAGDMLHLEDEIKKELDRIQSGEFDVFYGPVKDQDGNIRVEKGENMSDEVLLNRFDWYVEGVVFYE